MTDTYGSIYANIPDPITGETKESLDARRQTSTFANRVHVLVTGGVARITFGEQVRPGETNWHSSITMTAYDALRMADLIYTQDDADRARYAPQAQSPPPAPPPPEEPSGG